MKYTITAINHKVIEVQHEQAHLCACCRKHFVILPNADVCPLDYTCTHCNPMYASSVPFFPSNYNPNDPEFTGEYEGPAYDFNSDDCPF